METIAKNRYEMLMNTYENLFDNYLLAKQQKGK